MSLICIKNKYEGLSRFKIQIKGVGYSENIESLEVNIDDRKTFELDIIIFLEGQEILLRQKSFKRFLAIFQNQQRSLRRSLYQNENK